jgi:hypothetical protein
MRTATTKEVRRLVRSVLGSCEETWTDKCRTGEQVRRVAFKIGNCYTNDLKAKVERDMRALFTLCGFDNDIKVTDSTQKITQQQLIFCRNNTGVYLRIKAVIG